MIYPHSEGSSLSVFGRTFVLSDTCVFVCVISGLFRDTFIKLFTFQGITPDRSKRRRIECKRYSGFVIEPLKRTDPTKPGPGAPASSPRSSLFSTDDAKISCPRSKKPNNFPLELTESKVVTARQKQTLHVPLHHLMEYDDLLKMPDNSKVHKTSEEKSFHRESSIPGTEEPKDLTVPQHSSQTDNDDVASNPTKIKRKHALCAIFEDIWKPKKTADHEKQPQINGFRQMFNDVFSKVPQVCEKRMEISAGEYTSTASQMSDNVFEPTTKDEPAISEASTPEPKNIKKLTDSFKSENVNFDLLLSHEEVVETPQSDDVFSTTNWLKSVQSVCTARGKRSSLQLIIRKCVPPPTLSNEHRKKRKRRSRKRKTQSHVADADDEQSDSQPSQPGPCSALSGPLKLITLEDLWVQKEFYLRYLCNYYHISSEGCKGWLISRLHQFILQSAGNKTFSRHRTFKLFPTSRKRPSQAKSWVKLTVERKAKLLDE